MAESSGALPRRIAITGASGTGKTTLARVLAERFGVPLIKEEIAALLAAQSEVSRLAARGRLRRSHLSTYADLCLEEIGRQTERFGAEPGFISDRFAVDVLARMLRDPFDRVGEDRFQQVLNKAREQLGQLDLIVITPLSEWAFQPSRNDTGLQRNVSVLAKTRIHSLYGGLSVTLAPSRTLFLPGGDTRHDRWLPLISAALAASPGATTPGR